MSIEAYQLLRESSYGINEPLTATIPYDEDETGYQSPSRSVSVSLSHRSYPRKIDECEEKNGELGELNSYDGIEEQFELHQEYSIMPPSGALCNTNALRILNTQLLLSNPNISQIPSKQMGHPDPTQLPNGHSSLNRPAVHRHGHWHHRRSRVFHSFFFESMLPFLQVGDICPNILLISKEWRKFGLRALSHPHRRMEVYMAQDGGRPILNELKRMKELRREWHRVKTSHSLGYKGSLGMPTGRPNDQTPSLISAHRYHDGDTNEPLHTHQHDQSRDVRDYHVPLMTSRSILAPPSALLNPSNPPSNASATDISHGPVSLTLIQHLQMIPSNSTEEESNKSQRHNQTTAVSYDGHPFISTIKRLYYQYICRRYLVSNRDCQLLSHYLVHLRVLRIFDGSEIGNAGIAAISEGLKRLRMLHIGHLSDRNVNDLALEYISQGLTELHSLWLTQDMTLPSRLAQTGGVRGIWNHIITRQHRPTGVVYNLFTNAGVTKLIRLHATLRHINLAGFKNLTVTGLRLISTGQPRLYLHSLHLNGWHIGDESIVLLSHAHSVTLYHLHLFDVDITNHSMELLAQMPALETIIFDHVNQVDEFGMKRFLDAAVDRFYGDNNEGDNVERHENKPIPQSLSPRSSSLPAHSSHSAISAPAHCNLSLRRLEIHSCSRLQSLWSIRQLILHPTLRECEVSGKVAPGHLLVSNGVHSSIMEWQLDARCHRVMDEIEEFTHGRIQCNGGRQKRHHTRQRNR